jgi:hypothetical protein
VVINANINQNIDTVKNSKFHFERFIDMRHILQTAGKLRDPQQMTVVENNTERAQEGNKSSCNLQIRKESVNKT